jgi:GNAT superfamily N-acetyltransferase
MDVRPATSSDAASLAALRWEFRAGRDVPTERENEFVTRCERWMHEQLRSGVWRAWVAEVDGRIVGQVWVMIVAKVPNPVGERDCHAYLSNLFVIPSLRGGVGSRLLNAALTYVDSLDVDRVVLWPSPKSATLYERNGFTRAGSVMERSTTPRHPVRPRK